MDILERQLPHWDPATAAVGAQVPEMKDHTGIVAFKPGSINPFDSKYLANVIDPVEGMLFVDLLNRCTADFIKQTGRPDISTWDKRHFEETLMAYYFRYGEDNKLYPIYPPKYLIGLGILPNNMGNPEYEAKGRLMVRNRTEEIAAWNRWFAEFMAEDEEGDAQAEADDAAEQYLELLRKGGTKGASELKRMVERKKAKGQSLCLSF